MTEGGELEYVDEPTTLGSAEPAACTVAYGSFFVGAAQA